MLLCELFGKIKFFCVFDYVHQFFFTLRYHSSCSIAVTLSRVIHPLGAASGTMSMVIGGEKDVVESVLSLLQDMSVTQVHIGDVGAGNIAKIANNLLCAAHLITNAEVVSLAVKAGVDPEKVLEGINAGSGRSGVSQVNFPKWILNNGYDSGFSMGLMRKDVGLAQKLADDLNLSLPLSRQIIQMWQQSQDITDQEDFNAIVKASDPTLF